MDYKLTTGTHHISKLVLQMGQRKSQFPRRVDPPGEGFDDNEHDTWRDVVPPERDVPSRSQSPSHKRDRKRDCFHPYNNRSYSRSGSQGHSYRDDYSQSLSQDRFRVAEISCSRDDDRGRNAYLN